MSTGGQDEMFIPTKMENGKIVEMPIPQFCRELHIELCRQVGMTADEIIEDWNRRSPDDPW